MRQLILPSSYEAIVKTLEERGDVRARLMEFVVPVEQTEADISELIEQMGGSGRLVLLLGRPGSGKSTFVESLSWRKHVNLSEPIHVDASGFSDQELLAAIAEKIREIADDRKAALLPGRRCVVIDYLEHLEGQSQQKIRSFFRTLNGILRRNDVLVVWPVTSEDDASSMLAHASDVSGTIFQRDKAVISFTGPPLRAYPTIASQTISVLNEGLAPEQFNLTPEDLEHARDALPLDPPPTLREYLEKVYDRWKRASGFVERIRNRIPKQTEVWFVFSHPDAESVISQFVRKTKLIESAWTALHAKLYEYIHDTQREADWNPTRLQLAIGGALTTRILYLPTNALVTVVAAYAPDALRESGTDPADLPGSWTNRSDATKRIKSSPLYRQLVGDAPKMGMRRSGPAARAAEQAEEPFAKLARWTSGSGSGSDKRINAALAEALEDALGGCATAVVPEAEHPWIGHVYPDIRVDSADAKHICLECSYTDRREPYVVASYVLGKLDRYMKQLEALVGTL